jgi:hypothetical protein
MKFLTAIMGKTKGDRIRNAYIREKLRMEDTQSQTEGNRSRRFGHVERMDEHRIPKKLLVMNRTGKRPRGTPRTPWLDQVKVIKREEDNPVGR